jgi:glutaredoxin-like protein NrdH
MVIVYTKPSCVQCEATKRMMDKLGIKYSTVDVTVDADALDLIISKGFKSAPVVVADNDAWAGFNPDKISGLVD